MPKKILTITKSAEFKEISKASCKFYAKSLLVLQNPTPEKYHFDQEKGKNAKEFCRIGYTVSKIVGNAVTRNLAKRRLREAFRDLAETYAKDKMDYVIIAKKEIAEAEFAQIVKDLEFCLKRVGNKK